MRTFPRFAGTYRTAMELDHRARRSAGSLAVVERRTLVRTPLLLLFPRGEQQFASMHLDKEVGYAVLAVLAATLRPLLPTDAELHVALEELRDMRHKIRRKWTSGI